MGSVESFKKVFFGALEPRIEVGYALAIAVNKDRN
jgi:hypothetical protein